MRKYIYTLLLATLTLFACTNKNEGLLNLLGDLDGRITALEALCKELNTNVQSIQTIVEAVETGDYITNITPIMQDGKQVGYTITFAKHDAITIYNGENGKDGVNGTNGSTPILGAAKDTDGIYYWTLNGEWLLDGDGHKIRVTGEKGDKGDKGDTGATGAAGQDGQNGSNGTNGTNGTDGVTPQLKIENDYWYISYNNGATWTQLGKAKGDKGDTGAAGTNGQDGDSMFQSVTYDENNVYFTLADGTVITIKNGSNSTGSQPNSEFLFVVEFDANTGVGTMPNDTFYYGVTKEIDYCGFGKDGYAFVGWNTHADGSGIPYANGQSASFSKNIKLYAQWEPFNGMLPGVFSVSTTKKVKFASGNLQYQASTNTWRFASNQYDYLGSINAQISATNSNWIDLFGYGTSGYATYYPYLTNQYFANTSPSKDYYPKSVLTRANNLDWGINIIENSIYDDWYTMSDVDYASSNSYEWQYLLKTREFASEKKAIATVVGIAGFILLPDVWKQPTGTSFNPNALHFYENNYTLEQWLAIASNGAVFLPAGGYRDGTTVKEAGSKVAYWSSNYCTTGSYNTSYAIVVAEGATSNIEQKWLRSYGSSVRLVREVK